MMVVTFAQLGMYDLKHYIMDGRLCTKLGMLNLTDKYEPPLTLSYQCKGQSIAFMAHLQTTTRICLLNQISLL